MNLTGIIKKCVKYALFLGIINQCAYPVIGIVSYLFVSRLPTQIRTNPEKIARYTNLPSEFDAVDYLYLASSLVHNESEYEGNCKDYVVETYNVYTDLLEQNKRRDLKKKIRSATGPAEDVPHIWIEIERKGEFIPYESMDYTPRLKINQIKDYSQITLNEKMQLNGDATQDKIFFRSFKGKRLGYPTFGAFIYPGGMARIIYKTQKYRFEEGFFQ